eukprot:gene30789-19394_t
MTVYRMTPWNVTDVADHDTGDIAGDMGFLLSNYLNAGACQTPPLNTQNCFLFDKPLVAAFPVEVDGNYGPYLMCNPAQVADGTVNTSDWQC